MTKNRTTIAVLGCWMTACALGMGVLSHYHFKPGDALAAPAVLTHEALGTQSYASETQTSNAQPRNSQSNISHFNHDGRSTLLVFVHPRCPCTRSTLRNLDTTLRALHATERPRVVIYVVQPDNTNRDWTLIESPSPALNAEIINDIGGTFADRFGARTSGHVVAYDASGTLRFAGGITPARGHEGPSAGTAAIARLHTFTHTHSSSQTSDLTKPTEQSIAPVYGCPLLDPDRTPTQTKTAPEHTCCASPTSATGGPEKPKHNGAGQ